MGPYQCTHASNRIVERHVDLDIRRNEILDLSPVNNRGLFPADWKTDLFELMKLIFASHVIVVTDNHTGHQAAQWLSRVSIWYAKTSDHTHSDSIPLTDTED